MDLSESEISNEQLEEKMKESNVVLLDVRETEEYALSHIPGSVLIPLGQLESRHNELNEEDDIYIVCRTGNRSGFACDILRNNGFSKVYNVLPGMSGWTGNVESDL